MTDHESENQSVDGSDSTTTTQPSFMADLAQAMRSTAAAERTRDAEATEERRQTYVDGIRAREAMEADELRELAKTDVAGIDAWSDGEIRRIKLERERRITERRDQLQLRLEEHRLVIGREVDAVEAAVGTYRADMDTFFGRLDSETDPVEIARQAAVRPGFPVLELIGPEDAPEDVVPTDTPAQPGATTEAAAAAGAQALASESAIEPVATNPSDERMVGVMADPASEDETSEPSPTTPDPASETEQTPAPTPVAAGIAGSPDATLNAAEVRGVIPRTGAGSWLRWPNSSPDRPDSNS
jgi:hypothetical protein